MFYLIGIHKHFIIKKKKIYLKNIPLRENIIFRYCMQEIYFVKNISIICVHIWLKSEYLSYYIEQRQKMILSNKSIRFCSLVNRYIVQICRIISYKLSDIVVQQIVISNKKIKTISDKIIGFCRYHFIILKFNFYLSKITVEQAYEKTFNYIYFTKHKTTMDFI